MKKAILAALFAAFSTALFAAANPADFFADAKAKAEKENKKIMVVFSGLEWCPPCQMFSARILKSSDFKAFAGKNLVFIEVDIKKNGKREVEVDKRKIQPKPAEEKDFKEAVSKLEMEYPHSGVPFAVVLDAKGAAITRQLGCPRESAKDFVKNLKQKIGK